MENNGNGARRQARTILEPIRELEEALTHGAYFKTRAEDADSSTFSEAELALHRYQKDGGLAVLGGLAMNKPVWFAAAACKGLDPDIFVPDAGLEDTTEEATNICDSCPIQSDCLEYAIENNEKHGIWGGKTRQQRMDIKRQRLDNA